MHPFNKSKSNFFQETQRVTDRNSQKFIQSVLEEQRRENIVDNVFLQSTSQNPYHAMVDEDTKLCSEIIETRRRRYLEQKKRQQLRESSQELQALERKLRAAYISKSLAAQKEEQEAIKMRERALEQQENEVLEKARLKDLEYVRQLEEEQRQKKELFKMDLQHQMELTCADKKKKYEDFLKEKSAIDEIIRKISEEQLQEMQMKLERKNQIHADLKEYMRIQEEWKKQQQSMTEEENQKIRAIMEERELDKQRAEEEKRRLQAQKAQLSEKIGMEISSIEESKRRREELLQDLLVEERNAKEEQRFREDLERQLRQRIATRIEVERHRAETVQRRKYEQEEEDRAYREQMMREMAERDKLEQLSDEKRRRKMAEHRRAIQECLDEKKRRKAEEISAMIKEREHDINKERDMQKLIEEERIRMLQEHAANLIGFLPPGVLKDSDREFIPLPPKETPIL